MIPAEDIIHLVKPGDIVCEIGCRKGRSTQAFLLAGAKVYTIDPWKEYEGYKILEKPDCYEEAINRLAVFGTQVTIVKRMSSEALPYIPMCDLVWIDGNHEYEYIQHDIIAYWKKVKVGGYLTGHDYTWPSVKRAVNECAIKNNLIFMVAHQSWVIEKLKNQPKALKF